MLFRSIVRLTADAVAAIERAPITDEARAELVALADYVGRRSL